MSHASNQLLAFLLLVTGFVPVTNATLVSRLGGQAVYDTDLNVTWLTNANLARTETFGVSGITTTGFMDGGTTQTWIAAMNASNGGLGYLGYNNWRLPTTGPVNGISFNYPNSNNGSTDSGYNISATGTPYAGSTGNEMAYLYYNSLSNQSPCNPVTSTVSNCVPQSYGLTSVGPFTNLMPQWYWSGTVYPNSDARWMFGFMNGSQYLVSGDQTHLALVVGSGDVFSGPPLPAPLQIQANPTPILPTKTPPATYFPAITPSFSSQIGPFAESTASQFDSPTAQNINLLVSDVKPLVDPQSGVTQWLKATAKVAAPDIEKSAGILAFVSNVGSTVVDWATGSLAEGFAATVNLWGDPNLAGKVVDASPAAKQIYDAAQTTSAVAGCLGVLTPGAVYADLYFCLVGATASVMAEDLAPALRKFGADPPDPSYTSIFQANTQLPTIPSTGDPIVDRYYQNVIGAATLAGVYLNAVNASLDKYAGAYLAGDTIYMAYQMQAYLAYLKLYDQALHDLQTNLKAFGALVDLSQFNNLVYDPLKLITLQQNVALNGFSTGLIDYFKSLGYTPEELEQLQAEFIAFDPYSLEGTALDALNLLQDGIALASSLPDRTDRSIPEPSTIVLILIAAAILMLARLRNIKLASG